MSSSPERRQVAYGRHHELQNIIISPIDSNPDGYWVVQVIQTESSPQGHSYIHGGAWRDPTITASSFEPTEALLRSYPGLPISGFASISYRLSAHPDYPQNKRRPQSLNIAMRNIRIISAIRGAGLYVSCSLAAEVDCTSDGYRWSGGIYDLRKLQNDHRDSPAYREIIEGAFGTDELLWDAVSPAQMEGSRGIEGGWKTGRLVVLAHSKDDELVDEGQQTALLEALKGWESKEAQIPKRELAHRIRHVRFLPISGGHDEAWSIGEELARAVKFTFVELQKMGIAPEPEFLGGSERV
ncbi:hypothetical protein N7470_007740 [Penicillium chermesinum]|nr:hypothetical protein N7470_007740 [Penicillium chermesinum]